MSSYTYDLHIHSCLSPCGDDDMTPANIAGMAMIQGLKIVALTDHNTSKNCPAFFTHAKRCGIIPLAGMELTTAEDIHVICLFSELERAMEFDSLVSEKLFHVKNKPAIFGNQFIMDENDKVVGEVQDLLINATSLDAESAYKLCTSMGGACYPAHIDRQSGGMIAILGDIPADIPYTAFELNDKSSYDEYAERFPHLKDKSFVVSSDAHNLWSIAEAENTLELESEDTAAEVIRFLRGEG